MRKCWLSLFSVVENSAQVLFRPRAILTAQFHPHHNSLSRVHIPTTPAPRGFLNSTFFLFSVYFNTISWDDEKKKELNWVAWHSFFSSCCCCFFARRWISMRSGKRRWRHDDDGRWKTLKSAETGSLFIICSKESTQQSGIITFVFCTGTSSRGDYEKLPCTSTRNITRWKKDWKVEQKKKKNSRAKS